MIGKPSSVERFKDLEAAGAGLAFHLDWDKFNAERAADAHDRAAALRAGKDPKDLSNVMAQRRQIWRRR